MDRVKVDWGRPKISIRPRSSGFPVRSGVVMAVVGRMQVADVVVVVRRDVKRQVQIFK